VRRADFAAKHNIPADACFDCWSHATSREKWADVVFICTQDNMHYEPALAAITQGYHVLLEKPISPSPDECLEIAAAATAADVKVVVCHVLRYTPFFSTIKDIIDSGEIGRVVSIVHNENVGNLHHAHSFVRGNWGNSSASSPMILAKSCHDTDIMQWLVGKKCLSLSSFGSLTYFNGDNKPAQTPPRCTDGCAVSCAYDARKLYLNSNNEWFRSVAAGRFGATEDEVQNALEVGPYGRCVFQCDNDVVDHQVVSMLFEDDVTAIFSMSSFTPDISRSIKIMGTNGQIKAHTAHKNIVVSRFDNHLGGESERFVPIESKGGHSGGDIGIMEAFCDYVQQCDTRTGHDGKITEINISAQNHMISFAAEKSRLLGGAIVSPGDM